MAKGPKGKVAHNKYRRAKIYDYEDVRGVTDNWRSEGSCGGCPVVVIFCDGLFQIVGGVETSSLCAKQAARARTLIDRPTPHPLSYRHACYSIRRPHLHGNRALYFRLLLLCDTYYGCLVDRTKPKPSPFPPHFFVRTHTQIVEPEDLSHIYMPDISPSLMVDG